MIDEFRMLVIKRDRHIQTGDRRISASGWIGTNIMKETLRIPPIQMEKVEEITMKTKVKRMTQRVELLTMITTLNFIQILPKMKIKDK